MQPIVDKVWHRWLKRPYRLAQAAGGATDRQAVPVVLLHGLASAGPAWQHVLEALDGQPYRTLTLDLLGHGASPKPHWLRYDSDDHARMVIAAIERQHFGQPVIVVGHSMGCLVAVRIARLRPDLIRHLVLYEMPLYSGLPDKRRYRLRLNLYFKLYERVIAYKPIFSGPGVGKAQRIAEKFFGLRLDDQSWKPFIRSLKHTIMDQTTADDLKHVKVPMDVIYGSRDRVVFRGKTTALFGEDVKNVTAYTIKASHNISKKASEFLAQRIVHAATTSTAQVARGE